MTDTAAPPPDQTPADRGPHTATIAPPDIAKAERPTLYLVDGSGYIFRAFFALPPMTRGDGTPTNAVFGFCNMLIKLLADIEADRLAVIFDASSVTFRNEIYADYKANRDEPPEDLVPQFALIRDAVRAFNVPCIELEGYEADDLIATYARLAVEEGDDVIVVSSDKDLMQLVSDNVRMFDPIKNRPIGPGEVREKFGVEPDKVIDVQALCGDSVDNVPGIRGIGTKTAAELINHFGSLDALLERAHEIKQPKRRETIINGAEDARLSRRLVTLDREVPVPVPIAAFTKRPPDVATLRAFFEEMEFRRLVAQLDQGLVVRSHEASVIADGTGATAGAAASPVEQRYELIQDIEALDRWIDRAVAAGIVAYDTETSSLDALHAELVGVSLAVAPGEACYIPVGHVDPAGGSLGLGDAPRQIPKDQLVARLKPVLEDPAVLKIAHNAKYDSHIMRRLGIEVAPVDDTMLISYVLDGSLHGHGMDELAELHLGHVTIKYAEVAGSGRNHVGFARVPLDRALAYAAEDADITLRLHHALKPRLLAERMVTIYERLERPLVRVVRDMERSGVMVDRRRLAELSADFAGRLATLERDIHALAGRSFNIGSPKQLGIVLFEEHKLRGGKRGKNGDWGTGSEVLEPLAAEGHALAARILDWRQLAKLKSTYADALVEQISPETGRVHTSFSLAATSTGRLSSTDPNLQNIPIRTEEGRKIRSAFVAEEGHLLLSVDYSQIELRLLAEIAQIETLKEAFRAGIDIHALTASEVFGVPLEGMDKETRRRAKTINFGIIYGISAFGLARQLGVPQGEAAAFIAAYFARYPGIRDYMERAKQEAREHGFVRTLMGRKCHVPGIRDKNPARRGFAERQAINAPIQGSAADVMKRAMLRVPPRLAAAGLRARMLLQVHDELLFEVPEAEAEATAELVRATMEGADGLDLPLVAEAGLGHSWAEAH